MAWIHAVLDLPADVAGPVGRFWSDVLCWPLGGPWPGHAELRSFTPPEGSAYVHLQHTGGPPRVHLDLEADDPARTVEDAVASGAELVATEDRWHRLASPGGLPFCVVRAQRHAAPPPTTWPDGHRSRMVQVCVDAPRAAHAREVEFWRGLLDGPWTPSPAAEFAGKWHDDEGSPLQLLFQRLDEPSGPVRAHLDHGTDDLAAEVRRLVGLGAEDVGAGHGGWHVLRDPAALPFCVTENSPEQRRHRDLG